MRARRWIAAGSIILGLAVGGCSASDGAADTEVNTTADSQVQDVPGGHLKQIRLTPHAVARLGIRTVTVGRPLAPTAPAARPVTVVPYSAVLYAPDGSTWVYTVPQPLTYVRQQVVVTAVRGAKGDQAYLSTAPPAGTTIVSVGVVELYGTELGIGAVEE
jgi:hypothetical protein